MVDRRADQLEDGLICMRFCKTTVVGSQFSESLLVFSQFYDGIFLGDVLSVVLRL
jgi:hypothetical protein